MTSPEPEPERPTARRRPPVPSPDEGLDPVDPRPPTPPHVPIPLPPAAQQRPPAPPMPPPAGAPAAGTVVVSPKGDGEGRAKPVQLGVRVAPHVDEHLDAVAAATGRTRRELVEQAILALRAAEVGKPARKRRG